MIKVSSYFSGCSGAEKVLHEHKDFEVVSFCENETAPSNVLRYHYPDTPNLGDIELLNPLKTPECDVLIAGFPCKGISTQGKQEGFDNEKTKLFKYLPPIIKIRKPKYIIFENVQNLVSKDMRDVYEYVIRSVRSLGYRTNTKLIDSSNYGTPQQRVRTVIFCVRKEIEQIRAGDFVNVQRTETKVTGFKGLDDSWDYVSWSKSTRKKHYDCRIREDGLINTLTTGFGCKGASTGTMVVLNDEVRPLTVNECEVLMTWDKFFTEVGTDDKGKQVKISDSARYAMCGNGVASNIILPYRNIILGYEGLTI